MQTLAHTFTIAYGCPPELFDVSFSIGGDRETTVSRHVDGQVKHLRFCGKGYRPGSKRHLAWAIETFLALSRSDNSRRDEGPEFEEADFQPVIAGRLLPRTKRADVRERQLPVRDRA